MYATELMPTLIDDGEFAPANDVWHVCDASTHLHEHGTPAGRAVACCGELPGNGSCGCAAHTATFIGIETVCLTCLAA
jgi:hypothetical protein